MILSATRKRKIMNYFALRSVRFLIVVFVTAVATCSVTLAAEVPSGITDVRWGASVADIKRAFGRKPGVELAEEAPGRIVYRRGEFAGYPVERWELEIGPSGLWRGSVYFIDQPNHNRQFDNLAASLGKKYGKASPFPADGKAAGATWKLNDPSTGRKGVYTVFIRYSWAPYEFVIRYSYDPNTGQASPTPSTTKDKKDL